MVREAKQFTTWTTPNDDYEAALKKFIEGAMADTEFSASVAALVKELTPFGWINSLSQTLLKLTVPGVPDIYQGCELWDLRLVDPDNRTPVDFDQRRKMLGQLEELKLDDVLARWDEGLPKLWTIHRALVLRQSHAEIFNSGSYKQLLAAGDKAAHAVAFVRGDSIVSIVSRLVIGLDGNWGNTSLELPAGKWRNVLTDEDVSGGRQPLSKLLGRFPVALLKRNDG